MLPSNLFEVAPALKIKHNRSLIGSFLSMITMGMGMSIEGTHDGWMLSLMILMMLMLLMLPMLLRGVSAENGSFRQLA